MRGWFAKLLGNRGENAAARYLKQQGYCILFRNHKNQFGEIDIIARDQEWIVFVEVKTRSSTAAGHPTEAVTKGKQIQLTKLAMVFLKRHHLLNHRARFDVVSILWSKDEAQPLIEHYMNAFPAIDR
jgi:putative endonuclease